VFGKLQFDLAHGGRIAAHVLHGGDNLKYIDSSEPAIRSQYVSDYGWLTWDARLGSRVREQSVVSFGRLRWTRLGEGVRQGAPFASVTDRRSLETGELRQDWSVDVASRAFFKIGVDARHEHASYNYFRWLKESYLDANKQPQTRVDTTVAALAPRGDRLGAYVAQRLRPVDALTLEAGVRYDRAWHTGDADFGPRASLSWQPTSSTTMRAAWGIYSQTQSLFGLQVEDGVTRFAPAERAEQRIVGVEQLLP
jgi:outer membrane receptor protein involved in Fe transport